MVCAMPRFMNQIENMEIETPENTENVKPKTQIKILGYLFNTRGNIDNQVNKLKSACHAIMHIAFKHRTIMQKAAQKAMSMNTLYIELITFYHSWLDTINQYIRK